MIPYLHLGPLTVPTFGLMVALALITSAYILQADFVRRAFKADAFAMVTVAGLAGILGAKLYVTVEPCAMCAGAIIQARIRRVVYGCDDPKAGAVRSCFQVFNHPALNHSMEVTSGVLVEDCVAALQSFFAARRS